MSNLGLNYNIIINYGDGSNSSQTINDSIVNINNHVYASPGNYIVTVSVPMTTLMLSQNITVKTGKNNSFLFALIKIIVRHKLKLFKNKITF